MVAQINTVVTQYTLMHNNSGDGDYSSFSSTVSIRNKNACHSNKYTNFYYTKSGDTSADGQFAFPKSGGSFLLLL